MYAKVINELQQNACAAIRFRINEAIINQPKAR